MATWKAIKKMVWQKDGITIKYWQDNETGGYDVYKKGKKLNKVWLPSFLRAAKLAKQHMRK